MLRTIKTSRPKLEVQGFTWDSNGSTVSGQNESSETRGTVTSPTPGVPIITFDRRYAQAPICVATRGESAGSTVDGQSAATATQWILNGRSSGDVVLDGIQHVLAVGQETDDAGYYAKDSFALTSRSNTPRIIWGVINGFVTDGGIVNTGQYTHVRTGTGEGTVTFDIPFAGDDVTVLLQAQSSGNSNAIIHTATSATGFTYDTTQYTSTSAADASFAFIALGYGRDSAISGIARSVKGDQRMTRFEAGRIVYTSGTPALLRSSSPMTLTDQGTGLVTIALDDEFAFQRRSAIFSTSFGTDARIIMDASDAEAADEEWTSKFRLRVFDNTNSSADPEDGGGMDFIIIGSDDPIDY